MSQNFLQALATIQAVASGEQAARARARMFERRAETGGLAMNDLKKVMAGKDADAARQALALLEERRRDLGYYFTKVAGKGLDQLQIGQTKAAKLVLFLKVVLIGIPLVQKMADAVARGNDAFTRGDDTAGLGAFAEAMQVLDWDPDRRFCDKDKRGAAGAAFAFGMLMKDGEWYEKVWDEGSMAIDASKKFMVDVLEGTLIPDDSPSVPIRKRA